MVIRWFGCRWIELDGRLPKYHFQHVPVTKCRHILQVSSGTHSRARHQRPANKGGGYWILVDGGCGCQFFGCHLSKSSFKLSSKAVPLERHQCFEPRGKRRRSG